MKYDIENINKRKKNKKTAKKILDILIIILLYNIMLVFISCINKIDDVNIFGYKAYIITTNSMADSIKSGDIIIAKDVPEEELQVGDVITFEKDYQVITHRIIKIDDETGKRVYTTKGDNNNIEDKEKIEYEQIQGKSILIIPKLGYLFNFLENQIVFLLIVLILLILLFFRIRKDEKMEIRREKKKIEQEKRKESKKED